MYSWFLASLGFSMATAISRFPSEHWVVKGWIYGYHVLLFVHILLFLMALFWIDLNNLAFMSAAIVNLLLAIYLFGYIKPYLSLSRKEIVNSDLQDSQGLRISLLSANVLQDNRDYDRFIALIKSYDPDVILVVEVDRPWVDALAQALQNYSHSVEYPLENYYGMALWSKFRVIDYQVTFLVENDIPSMQVTFDINGRTIQFFGVHPRPPSPTEVETADAKNQEIILIAKSIQKGDGNPTVVAGDLNDVAWSRTTRLFQKISGLLDPRRGRGFYSTFPAKWLLIRTPIDHVFCSRHFSVVNMETSPYFGSDHLAICLQLELLASDLREANEALHVSEEEKIQAEEILSKDLPNA